MLRTNSKEVKAKVRQYIMDGFQPEAYGYEQYYSVDKKNFSCVAHAIYECLYTEKIKYNNQKLSTYEYFKDWMQDYVAWLIQITIVAYRRLIYLQTG